MLGIFALASMAGAQDVIMARPEIPVTPPALQQIQETNGMQVFTADDLAPAIPQETKPFKWGALTLRPHIFYRFLDGNGILASTNNSQDTIINEVSPGFLMEIGSHLTLDYTPTWTQYSNKQFRDTLDQAVRLSGGTSYEDWTFRLSQSYVSSSSPLIQTGTQTDQETYLTTIDASYRFNSKMSLDMEFNQKLLYASDFDNSREWATMDWLDYQFWPRFDAAVGIGLGYDNVETGSDMTFERYETRLNWRATEKISLQVHGGLEDRQFLSGGESDLINFVFGAAVQYQPFEYTRLSLGGDRAVAGSYFQNQVTETTGFTGGLNQRLLGKFYLDLGGTYSTIKYVGSASGVTPDRTDDYYSFNVRLSRIILKRGMLAAFYQISNNSSTQPGFAYNSNQFGFEISYQY